MDTDRSYVKKKKTSVCRWHGSRANPSGPGSALVLCLLAMSPLSAALQVLACLDGWREPLAPHIILSFQHGEVHTHDKLQTGRPEVLDAPRLRPLVCEDTFLSAFTRDQKINRALLYRRTSPPSPLPLTNTSPARNDALRAGQLAPAGPPRLRTSRPDM